MRIGIVGMGLIGGSIGLALRRPDNTVIGYDASEAASTIALQRQCVDRIAPIEEVAKAEVVFVACPPASVIECLRTIFQHKEARTIVTDCASYKGEIVDFAIEAAEPRFIPGHPMAGHEKSGAAFASAWMFKQANWILSPLKNIDKAALAELEALIKTMGARPVRLEAKAHDRQVALFSHLPHVIAGGLVRLANAEEGSEASAASWKDLTRVGGVDPSLWAQIMIGNRRELTATIERFESELALVKNMLQDRRESDLKTYLQEAAEAKKRQQPTKPAATHRPARKTR